MKDRGKRIWSFGLALMMALASVPVTSDIAWAAPAVTSPSINFTTNTVGGDNTTANVITGRTVTIKENIPAGYTSNKIVLRSTAKNITIESRDPDGTDASTSTMAGVDISPINPTDGTRTITFRDTFNPIDGTLGDNFKKQPLSDVYSIRSEYKSIRTEGEAVEALGTRSNLGTVTVVGNGLEIVKESKIMVKCIETEGAGGAQFEVLTGSQPVPGENGTTQTVDATPTGIFEGYKDAYYGANSTKTDKVQPNTKKDLYLQLRSGSADKPLQINLLLHPTQTTENQVPDPDNPGQYKGDGTYNNFIQKDTIFWITFSAPVSNAIILTVMTPQFAIQQIEGLIEKSDGEKNTDYIRLADGDSLEYLTQNFQLRQRSDLYGGDFRIKWKWTGDPSNTLNDSLIGIGEGQNTEWQAASVTQLEDNVNGVLTAKVTYYDQNNNALESSSNADKQPKKPGVVRGTGKPVALTAVQGIKGKVVTDSGTGPTEETIPINKAIKEGAVGYTLQMDAYQGGIPGYMVEPKGPYQLDIQLNMGAKNGTAEYATVSVVGGSEESIYMEMDQQPYKSGEKITNPQATAGDKSIATLKNMSIVAQQLPSKQDSQVVLEVKYFIPDRSGKAVESPRYKYRITLNLKDSTPSQDSSLKSLLINDQDNNPIDFPFSPSKTQYIGNDVVHIPYKAKKITITPTLNDPNGATADNKHIFVTIKDNNGTVMAKYDGASEFTLRNGQTSGLIDFSNDDLDVGKVYILEITARSQDPRTQYWTTYTVAIHRDPASRDDTLAYLRLFYENADYKNEKNNLITFKPDQMQYDIYVPYSTRRLRVQAAKNHELAEGPEKMEENVTPPLVGTNQVDEKQWLTLKGKYDASGVLNFGVTVKSEAYLAGKADAPNPRQYQVTIHRLDPNNDPTLKSMAIADAEDKARTFRPSFNSEEEAYTVEIPFSVKQLKFNLTPTDENVNNIMIYMGSVDESNLVYSLWEEDSKGELVEGDIKIGSLTPIVPAGRNNEIPALNKEPAITKGYYPIIIRVIAEDEVTEKRYEVRVQRAEPSKENRLKSLVLKDQDGVEIKTMAFHPDEIDYALTVPFETNAVSFTPTASQEGATIVIRDGSVLQTILPYEVESGTQSKNFNLNDPGEEKKFEVVVTPEDKDAEKKTYTIRITRGPPSDDARLKGLKADNTSEFKPLFIASKTEYTAKLAEGAEGTIITATANHPGATIKINGQVVPSGTPSDLIELIEIKQTIKVEVTAQDGKTKKVYNIEFTNENLIEKTNNADLKRLSVNYGFITPEFKSSVTEYEVTATENTWSVDVVPRVSDPLATMRVLNGTRELGDYNGNYALALVDGQNDITIEVTSPDKTVVKNYQVSVFRNEEEKLKNFTPLEAEDIDFDRSGNPIIVKVDEYPRVGASVFNTLREDYPEKTIIFQGNDYSVRFDAKNLTRVIPQTEIFDFRMSFDSPDEDAIYDIIEEREANDDILDDVVMMYFYYHGSLPGPASLNLSLGRKYGNETLYWHYYNQERDRLDYYGSLKSNSKGTVAVSIDHFSTYVVSPTHRIAGSEDKNGIIDELGMISNGKDLLGNGGKLNPDTGVPEDRP